MSALYRIRTAITGGPGGNELNTLYFNAAGGTEQQAATAVRTFWDAVKGVVHQAYRFDVESLVYTIDSTTGLATSTTGTTNAQVAATNAADPLPPMTNGVIRMHTGLFVAGRELVGKMWIPGPTENDNTNGIPIAAYITTTGTAFTTMRTTANTDLVVWSRKHFQFFTVTSGSTWNQWGSLRSRRQ